MMIFAGLFQNLVLLLGLVMIQLLILRSRRIGNLMELILSGVLFGIVGITGMMMPLRFAEGIIFDGRTIILSTAGLFSGPVAALIAAAMCAAYRIWLGGAGLLLGLATILESAAAGIIFFYLRKRFKKTEGPFVLFLFGLIVHFIMLILLVFLLPPEAAAEAFRKLTPYLLILYPLATMFLSLIFINQEEKIRAEKKILLNNTRLESIVRILKYSSENLNEFLDNALKEALDLTESRAGYIYQYSEDDNDLILKTSVERGSDGTAAVNRNADSGFDQKECCEKVIIQRLPVINNNYTSGAGIISQIHNFAAVPVISEEKIIYVILLADKKDIYDDTDVLQITLLMDTVWKVIERKLTEERLRDRLEVEKIVSDISAGFINTDPENIDNEINRAIEKLGKITNTDRVYVFIFNNVLNEISNTHEWCGFGIEPQKDNLQNIPAEYVGWWIEKMKQGGIVNFADINDMPEEASAEKQLLESQGILSIAAVPMYDNNEFIGFFGFDSVRRKKRWLNEDLDLLLIMAGVFAGAIIKIRHIREKEILEDQLGQAQKMESIGRLAGGIAHDFNNILQTIIGYSDILLYDSDPDSSFNSSASEIKKAALRSAEITNQLLAFARKQTISPRVVDLNNELAGIMNMLKRLIGEEYDLVFIEGSEPCRIKIDPSQLDQILTNLTLNAREAFDQDYGRITIETSCIDIDENYCAMHAGFIPGEYVMLAVSDNGEGMDSETIANIFEPFFTTRKKGTGLGMATVYGIVKQNSGFINVYSEKGRGSTFKLFFPGFREETAVENGDEASEYALSETVETILLVEDDQSILKLTENVLTRLGYKVLSYSVPEKALNASKQYNGDIHLLLTDVVMPGMNGRELAEKLKNIYSDIKCIYMSGYTANVIAHHGVLQKDLNFIQKPFSIKSLSEKVRSVLEQ